MIYRALILLAISIPAFAQNEAGSPLRVTVTSTTAAEQPAAQSTGYRLTKVFHDPEAKDPDSKSSGGIIYSAYGPGNVWHGEVPGFIPEVAVLGGEETIPLTDVYERGRFIYAHYGTDHYQTKLVQVIDENRFLIAEFNFYEIENVSYAHFDRDAEMLYYSVIEPNIGESAEARIHAFSIAEGKEIWQSDSGTSHGDFEVMESHLLTHYGFSGQDDFLVVLDKGNGKTLEKYSLDTAAEIIAPSDGVFYVPCYSGIYRFEFLEK
ncbi:MAG: hypothetical protein P1U68_05540 [Verrucomicrobiales bacterium]|nr:hypothetical protein [Verrucomicrobiales bacterium]